jgi:hypothetical protein
MVKPNKVIFVDDELERVFDEMSDEDSIKKAIIRVVGNLYENVFCGRNVKKKLIPKRLIDKYGVDNLWICNLPFAWRMVYTLVRDERTIKETVVVILGWMDHKDYEVLFGF